MSNLCGVCAGTGKPTSGLPCICDGIGTQTAEMDGLRAELLKRDKELEKYKQVVEAGKEIIKNSGYGHHAINLDYREYVALKIALDNLGSESE